ncbi:MAG: acyl-CoA dehydrogenase family protein [Chitinophagales bacterium]|nr:acyl-CoA dehydrogenase family protein [Chitinophagales bacterium]
MTKSPYFKAEHEEFRQIARQFIVQEVLPNAATWDDQRALPRSIWKRMGELGFLGLNVPEQYGGSGLDFFYSVAWTEEVAGSLNGGFAAAVGVHQYMSIAHIERVGSEYLKTRYLQTAVTGEKIGALAVSEPNAGSDVAALRSTIRRDGDHYILNGAKTFITNGVYSDFVVVACRLEGTKSVEGICLVVVDRDMPGFSANKLRKMGWHSSDTGELFFDNVRIPLQNLVGQEGMGFYYIMESFQLERLIAGIGSIAGAEMGLELTLKYINERKAFGKTIGKFQSLRHDLVNIATEIEAAKQLTYYAAWLYDQGETAVKECSMSKLLTTEVAKKAVDVCLQCFGGYGYMEEYPIERMYRDARVGTIVGGTSQIMREILSKMLIDQISFKPVYNAPENITIPTPPTSPAPPTPATANPNSEETVLIHKPIHQEMANAQTAREIVLSLPSRLKKHKVSADYDTTVHLDISGTNGGQFTVRVNNGSCTVEEGLSGTPKCVVTTSDSVYEGVETGRENAQMAVMFGKIKLTNIAEMMTFTGLFERISG